MTSIEKQRGVTLIELAIVVAIVAILTSVALPSFLDQMTRGNRAAAQSEMLSIANRQQQFLLSNRRYVNKTALEASGYALDADVAKYYSYNIAVGTGASPTYTITFTPKGRQSDDGSLTLNEQGIGTPGDLWDR